MSYDVSIKLPVLGLDEKYVEVQYLGNITWNVRDLIKHSSGWDIKNEANNGELLPWMQMIRRGISELESNPEQYKQYESPNGWGTIKGTLDFYRWCIKNAEGWISWSEELLPAAVVWVS